MPYVGTSSGVDNKLGVVEIFKMKEATSGGSDKFFQAAIRKFKEARKKQKTNANAIFNENLLKFTWPYRVDGNSHFYTTADQFYLELEECEQGYNGLLLQFFTLASLGNPSLAIVELKNYKLVVSGDQAEIEAIEDTDPKVLKSKQQSTTLRKKTRVQR